MKRIISHLVVVVAVGLGMSLAAPTSQAHEHDMRKGSFEGEWCGFAARFDLTAKRGTSWIFDGQIWIKATGQFDRLYVRQYADNSLYIIRYLSGVHNGKTQWVRTSAPETRWRNGRFEVVFHVLSAGGYGSKVSGHLIMPKN